MADDAVEEGGTLYIDYSSINGGDQKRVRKWNLRMQKPGNSAQQIL
ncbi:hypothetical protein CCACVL1_12577 [Corchorus capsularis]|uniref:Uncharacterized protein n=1 Tax=Corchorus capsularis TaxID=210143 RepID=A0A1R3IF13_COCAP|nr:hypothetical protein CCACVL1_12577 [Corchorus capsularis]